MVAMTPSFIKDLITSEDRSVNGLPVLHRDDFGYDNFAEDFLCGFSPMAYAPFLASVFVPPWNGHHHVQNPD